ncbi:hypothetical protein [Sphingomonas sp. CARO-RG-8B-R24-01]|uniref:hypothetical protein n=1 Tax=Sphingomonas sp. CARO-RG-8B-R24-01 TaxID=2914831 RepID=UPI001F58FEFA|nr:hypothetical protein [Sphingomonas sp. CARO-RG-8B-R24-01]
MERVVNGRARSEALLQQGAIYYRQAGQRRGSRPPVIGSSASNASRYIGVAGTRTRCIGWRQTDLDDWLRNPLAYEQEIIVSPATAEGRRGAYR